MTYRKCFCLVMCFVFSYYSFAAWNGSIDCSFGGGSDSAGDPFIISNDGELAYLHSYNAMGTVPPDFAAMNTNEYTFNSITAHHTFEVTFDIGAMMVATAGVGGAIPLVGRNIIMLCSSQTFDFTPVNADYTILDVKIDGVSNATAATSGSYTFNNITSNHTIEVNFTLLTYCITATAGTRGTITPTRKINLNVGEKQTFTFSPQSGYKIASQRVGLNNISIKGIYFRPIDYGKHTEIIKLLVYR